MSSSYQALTAADRERNEFGITPSSADLAALPPAFLKKKGGAPDNPHGEQAPDSNDPRPVKDGSDNSPLKDGAKNPPKKPHAGGK